MGIIKTKGIVLLESNMGDFDKMVSILTPDTGEKITTKNIIITFARNATLNDGEGKGRQTLYNVNNLKGYYITNGRAIEITCEKSSRSEQTVYKDLEGNEIDVNDGNTFVQICPIDAKVVIEGQEEPVEANTITEQ